MRGVGASLFTGGAAAGVPLAQASTTVASGGGILSNLFNGAAKVLSGGPLGVITGATAAAPAAATAAATGGLGSVLPAAAAGATDAALVAAPTATGMAPAWKGLGNFLQSEQGAGLLAGMGEGIGKYQEIKSYEDMRNADRQYQVDKDRRISESYDVDPSVYVGGPKTREAWKYNPQSGQIESVRA